MYRLTKPQKLIYDMEKYAGGSIATVCGSIVIEGNKEISEITNAVNELYRINDALRIRITESDGVPYQYVTEYQKQNIDVLHFKNKAGFNSYAQNFAREPFDFYGSLCDIKVIMLDDSYGILVKLHHIISDAWTLTLLGSQFAEILEGNTPEAYSYLDYINEEENYLSSKRYEKDREYYIDRFKKCDEVTYISNKQITSYEATRKAFIVDAGKTAILTQYAEKHNTSLFMLLMTALGVYLNRIKMNEENFYVGTAVLNRSGLKEQNTAGMFINTVPFLFELQNEKTFLENLENIANTSMSIFRHQKFNYGDILKTLRNEFDFSGNLYDAMLSYQNAKITGTKDKFETTWYPCGMQTESLQIHIDDRDSEGILKIHYDYQTEKFTGNEIEKMHEHIFNLLFDAIENDTKKIYELEILSQAERNTLLYEFNYTKTDYPKDKCVHQLFEEQVLKTPNKAAVIACDKTLTYNELNCLANRIAHGLIAKGVKPNDIVAFALPRNSYLIPVMFGILKSGAAYMPIDPDYPQERIDFMVKESNTKILINSKNINEYISNNDANPDLPCVSNSNFCILHTSGSTGLPKCAAIKHLNMLNFIYSNQFLLNNIDYVIAINTVTFDVFEMDTIFSVICGKICVLASEEQQFVQSEFESMMNNYKNCLFWATPTKMTNYINNSKTKSFVENISCYVVGGEVVTSDFISSISKYNNQIDIYTVYGPTETLIYSTLTPVLLLKKNRISFSNSDCSPINSNKSKCIHQLFEEQARITPDKIALKFDNKAYTYKQMNGMANNVAIRLKKIGVGRNDIVALISKRSYHLVVAILGILKAGGAYLPIDYNYPQERIDFIIKDSKCKAVITFGVDIESDNLIKLDNTMDLEEVNLQNVNTPEDLCAVIYTSGSTGNPKGTLLQHKGLVNYTYANDALYCGGKCNIGFATYTFDAFFLDIMSPMIRGRLAVMATENEQYQQKEFENLIKNNPECNLFITPAKLKQFIDNSGDKAFLNVIHNICVGGEVFPEELLDFFSDRTQVFNIYGPTECSIVSVGGKIK